MISTIRQTLTVLAALSVTNLNGVSIVYNLRIAQTTRRQALQEQFKGFTAAVTVFDQFRTMRDGAHQNTLGGLGTLIYTTQSLYGRADFAAGHVRQKRDRIKFGRTQTDDILFSAGYSQTLSQQAKVTYSGLLGLPTHNDLGLEGIQFGTGHIGLGAQVDGSYSYTPDSNHLLMAAARLIHFFPRTIQFLVGEQPTRFEFNIGKLADILIGNYSRWQNHRLEFGYNATFAFKARIHPHLDEVEERANFIRSSFYTTYQYRFNLCKQPSTFSMGMSYGFDHKPKRFGIKHGGTVWVLWGVAF